MSDSTDRMERLEREVRRLRTGLLTLAVALAATFALGATKGTPDELTLRKLAIVDSDGKERIIATSFPSGEASIAHRDRDGKLRIVAGTLPDGEAGLHHYDRDGKIRIVAGTLPDGEAAIAINDGKEQLVWGETSSK